MYYTLAPAQRDTMVMDREKLFKQWRLDGRNSVMNVLQMGLLVSSRNGATSGPLKWILAQTRDRYLHTLHSFIEAHICTFFLDLIITHPGDMNQGISVPLSTFPSPLCREPKTSLHTFPWGGFPFIIIFSEQLSTFLQYKLGPWFFFLL